jgi:hypothetical protein
MTGRETGCDRCHEVYRNLQMKQMDQVLSSVTPPRPEQADDFHRWYLEVLDRAGIDLMNIRMANICMKSLQILAKLRKRLQILGWDLRAGVCRWTWSHSSTGRMHPFFRDVAPGRASPYWWPDSPAATAGDRTREPYWGRGAFRPWWLNAELGRLGCRLGPCDVDDVFGRRGARALMAA